MQISLFPPRQMLPTRVVLAFLLLFTVALAVPSF